MAAARSLAHRSKTSTSEFGVEGNLFAGMTHNRYVLQGFLVSFSILCCSDMGPCFSGGLISFFLNTVLAVGIGVRVGFGLVGGIDDEGYRRGLLFSGSYFRDIGASCGQFSRM